MVLSIEPRFEYVCPCRLIRKFDWIRVQMEFKCELVPPASGLTSTMSIILEAKSVDGWSGTEHPGCLGLENIRIPCPINLSCIRANMYCIRSKSDLEPLLDCSKNHYTYGFHGTTERTFSSSSFSCGLQGTFP